MAVVEILRRWWRMRYPGYLLGVVVGLVMMWLPYKTYHDNEAWQEQLRTDGVPTQGVIDQLIRDRRGKATMHLRYEFAGLERRVEVACMEVCHPAGTSVRIWVNPDDPVDFVTDFGMLSGHRGRFQGVIGVVGLILSGSMALAGYSRLAQRRHEHRRRDWQRQQRVQRRQQVWRPGTGRRGKPSTRGRKKN